jgi:hypothetical protein
MRFSGTCIWLESCTAEALQWSVLCNLHSCHKFWRSSFFYPVTLRTFNYMCTLILCRNATTSILLNNLCRYILEKYFYKRCFDLKLWWPIFVSRRQTPNQNTAQSTVRHFFRYGPSHCPVLTARVIWMRSYQYLMAITMQSPNVFILCPIKTPQWQSMW